MLGKVYIVLDFDNEAQKAAVQEAFKEISNTRAITGRQIEQFYPFFRRNRQDLAELFNLITANGVRSILSMRGAQLISRIAKQK